MPTEPDTRRALLVLSLAHTENWEHLPDGRQGTHFCEQCSVNWPCPSVRAIQDIEAALQAAEAREGELLAALRADRYLHGVWAWREGLQEGQFGYQRTPEVERVLRAFAALEPPAETQP
jgi:hypothetical protein